MLKLTVMTKEIPSALWEKFFLNFGKKLAANITIQHLPPGGVPVILAQDASLVSMALQKQNGQCSDLFLIETGLPREKPVLFRIVEPIQILFRREKDGGRFNHLEILAEDGTTKVTFHPGIEEAALDKMMERVSDAP
jgi:hypothetical protein